MSETEQNSPKPKRARSGAVGGKSSRAGAVGVAGSTQQKKKSRHPAAAKAKSAPAAKVATKAVTKAAEHPKVPFSERQRQISDRAYFLAERRGFQSGYELDDWLEAERYVDQSASGHAPQGS